MRRSSALVVALATLLLAGCLGIPTDVAATVDGEVIHREAVEREVRDLTALSGSPEQLDPVTRGRVVDQQQREVLRNLVLATAMESFATERGVEVDREQAEEFMAELEVIYGEQLDDLILEAGFTPTFFVEVMAPFELRLAALVDARANEGATVEAREVRHIVVETDADIAEARALLDAGEAFADVAVLLSLDTMSALEGGNLGAFPQGAFAAFPEFEDAIWAAGVGEVVGPVETEFGLHLLEVTAVVELAESELDPFGAEAAARDAVETEFSEWLAQRDVRVAPGLGTWDADATTLRGTELVGSGTLAPVAP